MKLFNIILFVAFAFLPKAEARRVAERVLDQGEVDRIFVAPGLATSLEFPENVKEVTTGAPQIFKTMISSADQNEVILTLSNTKPFKTNLIVRTVKRTLVFDLIPSLSKHQDLIVVKDTYGILRRDKRMSLHEKRLRHERGEEVEPPTEEDAYL